MPTSERVTVTLPHEIVREIERMEKNRSKFVLEAVRRELLRRRREELRRSLSNPHPDIEVEAERGLDEWVRGLPADDAADLVDLESGTAVRWSPGGGWIEDTE